MDSSEPVASELAPLEGDAGAAAEGIEQVRKVIDSRRPAAGETLLLTVRHALTIANAAQITGSPDDELSELGIAQAEAGGRLLAPLDLDAARVSPMRRTRQTAELLLRGRAIEPQLEPLCAERSYGMLEGLTNEQVAERYPEVRHHLAQGISFSIDPPGGESLDDLRNRASRLLDSVLESNRGGTVLIVSHGNLIQQLHGQLRGLAVIAALGQPIEEIWNCALNAFRVDENGRAIDHALAQLAPVNDRFPLY